MRPKPKRRRARQLSRRYSMSCRYREPCRMTQVEPEPDKPRPWARLSQTPTQVLGIPLPMEHSNNNDTRSFLVECKIYRIGPAGNPRLASHSAHEAESFGIPRNCLHKGVHLRFKAFGQRRFLGFVPNNSFPQLSLRFSLKGERRLHRYDFSSFWRSARTSFQGRHCSGCLSASSARRSNSAACSGVRSWSIYPSSPPNSFQIRSTRFRFSPEGSSRICSRISVILMNLIYLLQHSRQGCLLGRGFALGTGQL